MVATMIDPKDEAHIGDGVYVCHDGYQLWIRANNARWDAPMLEPGVALEGRVIAALIRYGMTYGYLPPKEDT